MATQYSGEVMPLNLQTVSSGKALATRYKLGGIVRRCRPATIGFVVVQRLLIGAV